jgi:hypothetical protein
MIFELDAHGSEFVADAVGLFEVFGTAGRIASLDFGSDFSLKIFRH